MYSIKLLLLFVITLAITACGGGNDGRVDNPGSSSSSSSSSSIANCASAEGGVFIDDVCSPWLDVSAYEQINDPFDNYEVTDGEGVAVSFAIIDSEDPAHNQVINIQYAPQSDYSAAVRMLTPEHASGGWDMSEYATGKVIFDLKIINAGETSPDIEINFDCIYPCTSTPKLIKPVLIDEWQTIEMSVAELVDRGLDLEHVTTAFMITPTWHLQGGAHFQLDNVRWEKGSTEPLPAACFANYFDTPWVAGTRGHGVTMAGVDFEIPLSQHFEATQGVNPYVTLKPDWSLMRGVWTYSLSEGIDYVTGEFLEPSTLSTCSAAGSLSFEIYVPQSYVDDASLTFKVHAEDKFNQVYELSSTAFSMADMTPDDWNTVSITLSDETHHEDLKFIGLTFDSSLIDPDIDDFLRIDNILIKQPAE